MKYLGEKYSKRWEEPVPRKGHGWHAEKTAKKPTWLMRSEDRNGKRKEVRSEK